MEFQYFLLLLLAFVNVTVVACDIYGQPQQVVSFVPTTTAASFGLGGVVGGEQTLLSTIPLSTAASLGLGGAMLHPQSVFATTATTADALQMQPSLLQIIRHPSLIGNVGGGVPTTTLVGQPTILGMGGQGQMTTVGMGGQGQMTTFGMGMMPQVIGAQSSLAVPQVLGMGLGGQFATTSGSGVSSMPLVVSSNGLGISSSGAGFSLPYPYTSGAQVVGMGGGTIPVVITPNGLQINSGFQSVGMVQPTASVIAAQQPVIRQAEDENSALVQLDPMDAALMEMENQGNIHMEKYAWGRSAPLENDSGKEGRRANYPVFYAPLPTGNVVSSSGRIAAPQSNTRSRNPFADASGKRKKHFEHYQYFRNLDLTPTPIPVKNFVFRVPMKRFETPFAV